MQHVILSVQGKRSIKTEMAAFRDWWQSVMFTTQCHYVRVIMWQGMVRSYKPATGSSVGRSSLPTETVSIIPTEYWTQFHSNYSISWWDIWLNPQTVSLMFALQKTSGDHSHYPLGTMHETIYTIVVDMFSISKWWDPGMAKAAKKIFKTFSNGLSVRPHLCH